MSTAEAHSESGRTATVESVLLPWSVGALLEAE